MLLDRFYLGDADDSTAPPTRWCRHWGPRFVLLHTGCYTGDCCGFGRCNINGHSMDRCAVDGRVPGLIALSHIQVAGANLSAGTYPASLTIHSHGLVSDSPSWYKNRRCWIVEFIADGRIVRSCIAAEEGAITLPSER